MRLPPLLDLIAASPLPEPDGGKKERGTLAIVGGSVSCPGGAQLSGLGALRAGAGRVHLLTHPDVAISLASGFPEALVLGWDLSGPPPNAVAESRARADAVVVGPGLAGQGPAAATAAAGHVAPGTPLLLDAGALAAAPDLAGREGLLVTPNPDEAAKLLGDTDEPEDEAALAEVAARLVERLQCPVAVRGSVTVVDDGSGHQWCERSDVPGLGTAGSGDVLAGVIGGLLGRGAEPITALAWAIAAHAHAGRVLEQQIARIGFLARDVAAAIPAALQQLGR
jgi:hydroxyethylthiazole kinase-like uncharacterized protein yjeF